VDVLIEEAKEVRSINGIVNLDKRYQGPASLYLNNAKQCVTKKARAEMTQEGQRTTSKRQVVVFGYLGRSMYAKRNISQSRNCRCSCCSEVAGQLKCLS
jgi:hypothetical protein